MNYPGRKNLEDICDGDDLSCEIDHLQNIKKQQEQQLVDSFYELAHDVNPVNIMKDAIHGLASVRPPTNDVISMGTNIGTNYVIEKVLGKNRSIKGFLSALLVETLTTELINRNAPQMLNQVIDWGKQVGIDLEDRI
jgi:hypothetical protein